MLVDTMPLSNLNDASILRYYNNVRDQVDEERHSKHQFMSSDKLRHYADSLQEELIRRRVPFTPIQWSVIR